MEIFFNIIIFIFGASIGSFLNVLIDRLPNNKKITGRSHCDYCQKQIPWYDLFPIISFFILGGKTRCCHKKLSFQYPLIETITGLIFLFIYYKFNGLTSYLNLIILFGLVSSLLVIFVSDLKYHLISDCIQVAWFILSIFYHIANKSSISIFPYFFISSFVIALPIYLIYYLSREKAMGLGDVFLTLNIGFLLGWQKGFLALYIAFVIGAIIGILLMALQRKKIKSRIAFGPFLVIGTVTMLFWGEKALEIIKKMYGF
jgi:leader peptidase (prepilin peptidase) / N-methyltransferase